MTQRVRGSAVGAGHTSDSILAKEVNVAWRAAAGAANGMNVLVEWQPDPTTADWWPFYAETGRNHLGGVYRSAFPVRWRVNVVAVVSGVTVDYVLIGLE